ncbi:hypothetical protein Sjap_013040 [Stephania japonica]|uniref:Uncharacterized protein n=1 Tax=Stephania japonica TaxID=461633 RepID=A0AAP0IYY6_9MAGN
MHWRLPQVFLSLGLGLLLLLHSVDYTNFSMPEERTSNSTISDHPPPSPSPSPSASASASASPFFIEVKCKSSGKIRRFCAATKAGFALQIINRKLGDEIVPGAYIEAVKEGEEPVTFGPTSDLADYGDGWKLQTVVDEGFEREKVTHSSTIMDQDDPDIKVRKQTERGNNVLYIGKIFLALSIMTLFGSILTWGLENLPSLIG